MARVPKKLSQVMSMAIGQVIKTNPEWKAAQVKVPELHRDSYLNLYMEQYKEFWAADPEGKAGNGDIVRIKLLDEPQSDEIYHDIREVVFKIGRVVDPITGKRCRGDKFINEDLRRFGPNSKLKESQNAGPS